MSKIKIENDALTYPMSVTLIGATVRYRANFLANATVTRVNERPPLVGVSIGKADYTTSGILLSKVFSVNVPGADLMEKVDYCGIVCGEKKDKARLFTIFRGKVTGVPMINECRLCFECTVVQIVRLPSDVLFIGDVVGVYADEDCLVNGRPDVARINPFTLTMPDATYWRMGEKAGDAWSVGTTIEGYDANARHFRPVPQCLAKTRHVPV